MEHYYSYNDVFILPQYSAISSRRQPDTRIRMGDMVREVPVISSNMDTVTDGNMAKVMAMNGGIGAIHRFMSIDQNVKEFKITEDYGCIVSIGVNRDHKERAEALYDAGARYFVIDVAHGHSLSMKETLKFMRETFKGVYLIAGNVGTQDAIVDLQSWGADCIKVGLSGGKVCTTREVTGVETPMFTTIQKCSAVANVPLIADGSVRTSGDICKAIGAGASFVMCGYMFARSIEAPNWIGGKKIYRGMASQGAMNVIKSEDDYMPTPEGTEIEIDTIYSVKEILTDIKGALKSSMSYCNALDLKQFQYKVKFGYK